VEGNSHERPRLRLRFTLRQLLGLVALVAVAVPALMHASLWWAAAWLSGCLLVLGIALLGIVYRDGPRRAFWIGFALLGWGYTLTVYGPVLDRQVGHRLITTKVPAYAQLQRGLDEPVSSGPVEIALHPKYDNIVYWVTESGTMLVDPPQWDFFQQVGHSLFALLLAYVGGLVSRCFYATRSHH